MIIWYLLLDEQNTMRPPVVSAKAIAHLINVLLLAQFFSCNWRSCNVSSTMIIIGKSSMGLGWWLTLNREQFMLTGSFQRPIVTWLLGIRVYSISKSDSVTNSRYTQGKRIKFKYVIIVKNENRMSITLNITARQKWR